MTDLRAEAAGLLRELIACDTSNPPGCEARVAAIVERAASAAGLEWERVAKDPERPNLVVRLRGRGDGPSLAFVGHSDVVPVERDEWSVDPFAGVERDGAIWGRGAVDMKSQVAAVVTALASLAREGFRPAGDLMLVLLADEEVGDAAVGAPFFVEARPSLCPDFVVGEGAGERIPTPQGPVYLLDRGVKQTCVATLTVRGATGDASLGRVGRSAVLEAARLLERLGRHEFPRRVPPEVEELVALGPSPALDRLTDALTRTVVHATQVEADGPRNVIPAVATVTMQCVLLPGTTKEELERELRDAFGEGPYELELNDPQGGLTSPADSLLRDAIESFLAEHDPEARLVPALGYGFSDCETFREAYGSTTYGFIPFRHADPLTNLTTKHSGDERVLLDDLELQVLAARHIARAIGSAGTVGGRRTQAA